MSEEPRKPVAEYIPVRYRRHIYNVLGFGLALEAIWDLIPAGWESRLLASLAAAGFVLAGRNAT